jgi:ABC-type sugar transport system ATPase subunit
MTSTGQHPAEVILQAESVTKTFTTPDCRALPVLDRVSFQLADGEIVALLGKSGSGKSTLLRCLAGLTAPSMGTVTYRGTPLTGACPGVAMVFQSFALLPWLTVQQNVELGLQARGVSGNERRERALKAIDPGNPRSATLVRRIGQEILFAGRSRKRSIQAVASTPGLNGILTQDGGGEPWKNGWIILPALPACRVTAQKNR